MKLMICGKDGVEFSNSGDMDVPIISYTQWSEHAILIAKSTK